MTQNNPAQKFSRQGVAVWLDDLSRERLQSGDLAMLIEEKSVVMVTTNPTIFARVTKSDLCQTQIRASARLSMGVDEIVRAITTCDVRAACDVLMPVYERTEHLDGRASNEVNPRLARDEDKTVAEARLLWWLADQPNLFIRIPATLAGLDAFAQVISDGISVNLTLIFSIERYRAMMDAFMSGLKKRLQGGESIDSIGSVASFLVSRVHTEIDRWLDAIGIDEAATLKGKAGVANAILAYQAYKEIVAGDRWKSWSQKTRPL